MTTPQKPVVNIALVCEAGGKHQMLEAFSRMAQVDWDRHRMGEDASVGSIRFLAVSHPRDTEGMIFHGVVYMTTPSAQLKWAIEIALRSVI